jgi:hypothetical protein
LGSGTFSRLVFVCLLCDLGSYHHLFQIVRL